MTAKASLAREDLPLHRRIGAVQHAKNFALLLQNALRGCRSEHEKRLKLAEMEKTHHGIDIGRGKENARDRRVRFGLRLWAQFRRSEYLGAQIWTRGNQEPDFRVGIRRERNLRLRARTTA